MGRIRVIIESPYRDLKHEEAFRYLDRRIADSIRRGEAPFASHGLYTRALDDSDQQDCEDGIACGGQVTRKALTITESPTRPVGSSRGGW